MRVRCRCPKCKKKFTKELSLLPEPYELNSERRLPTPCPRCLKVRLYEKV